MKEEAGNDIFRSAADVVEAILTDQVPDNEPCAALPKPSSLSRNHNRAREKMRPDEPRNLDFEVSCVDDDIFLMFKMKKGT